MRTVVAAAIVDAYGGVISLPQPARHFHILQHMIAQEIPRRLEPDSQGFVDSEGNYVTRFRALQIARRAGQILGGKPINSAGLFSEDLW